MHDRQPLVLARVATAILVILGLMAPAVAWADQGASPRPVDLDGQWLVALVKLPPPGAVEPPLLGGIFDTSPGHLTKAHAAMDGSSLSDCKKCHQLGSGSMKVKNNLCTQAGCHDSDIGKHQANGLHFHGTNLVKNKTCGDCHTDHQGASFDIINDPNPKATIGGQQTPASAWGVAMNVASGSKKTWDHDLTTYKLVGGHKIDCDKCHKPADKRPNSNTRTFLGLKQECLACHANYHNFPAGDPNEDCLRCHTFITWKKFNLEAFDHDKTDFPLRGAHKTSVQCNECHRPKQPFKPLPHDSCETCHGRNAKVQLASADDGAKAHGATTFNTHNCNYCHNEFSWKRIEVKTAEHKKFAKFDAKGAHATLACAKCHEGLKTTPPKAAEDESNCAACHVVFAQGRANAIQHPRDKDKDPTLVFNNIHSERWMLNTKTCTRCHSDERWKPIIVKNEDHKSWANFDLTGAHLALDCIRCHRDLAEIPGSHQCAACHVDFHVTVNGATRGKNCENCHNTSGWMESGNKLGNPHSDPKYFFQLTGGHAKVACGDCHKEMDKGIFKVGSKCNDCHGSPHLGKLPDNCDKCHGLEDWTPASGFDHNRDSRFKLSGRHQVVACYKCHLDLGFRGTPMTCSECHWDYHKGAWGPTDCKECHNEVHWQIERGVLVFQSIHNFGEVVLTGAHEKLPCETCHNPSPRFVMTGFAGECDTCHPDVHLGGRGQQCFVCHSQNAWIPAQFNHAMTGFPLYGTHRLVRCIECHKGNVYTGLPSQCVFCHFEDAQQGHAGAGFPNGGPACEQCHTVTNWKNHFP